MEHIAVYGNRKTNERVKVTEVETIEYGIRVHFTRIDGGKVHVTGRNTFRKNYYNVSGVII